MSLQAGPRGGMGNGGVILGTGAASRAGRCLLSSAYLPCSPEEPGPHVGPAVAVGTTQMYTLRSVWPVSAEVCISSWVGVHTCACGHWMPGASVRPLRGLTSAPGTQSQDRSPVRAGTCVFVARVNASQSMCAGFTAYAHTWVGVTTCSLSTHQALLGLSLSQENWEQPPLSDGETEGSSDQKGSHQGRRQGSP